MRLKHLYKLSYISLSAILILFGMQLALLPIKALASETKIGEAISQDDFDKKLREGKDLMDKEDWSNAAKIFLDITVKYPANKSADAALYWLAFCYKKTGKFDEAVATLDRLLKEFPNSSWVSDAQVLQLETKKIIGDYEELSKSYQQLSDSYEKLKTRLPTQLTPPDYDGSLNSPMEREDEIKLAAFQGLLEADPKRAIEKLGDFLKPEAKTDDSLKRNLLRSVRSLIFLPATPSTAKNNQYVAPLREILIKSLQNETGSKLKTEIIYAIVNLNDSEANNYLIKIYSAEQDKEFKKVIIKSFNGLNFYSPEDAAKLTISSPIKFERLWEIFRLEKDTELRILTLSNLRRFTNWSSQKGISETLSQTYDAENDETFKLEIIRSLALPKENQALTKLMQIAKNDKEEKLRLEAIRVLQTNKTP